MSEQEELAKELALNVLWGKRVPTGATGYFRVDANAAHSLADSILAAGYRKPRIVTTCEELDALDDDSLVLASGKYLNGDGDFTDCWIRPIPDHVTGGTGARLWEALIYLDGGVHNMTRNDCITLPVTVLHEGDSK